jgi:hypothetical protein
MSAENFVPLFPVDKPAPSGIVRFVSGSWRKLTKLGLNGGYPIQMREEQFNTIMFHLRAMLGLICLQAAVLVGFAWKYL